MCLSRSSTDRCRAKQRHLCHISKACKLSMQVKHRSLPSKTTAPLWKTCNNQRQHTICCLTNYVDKGHWGKNAAFLLSHIPRQLRPSRQYRSISVTQCPSSTKILKAKLQHFWCLTFYVKDHWSKTAAFGCPHIDKTPCLMPQVDKDLQGKIAAFLLSYILRQQRLRQDRSIHVALHPTLIQANAARLQHLTSNGTHKSCTRANRATVKSVTSKHIA